MGDITRKFSEITLSAANFTTGDFLLGVQSGTADILFSKSQLFGDAIFTTGNLSLGGFDNISIDSATSVLQVFGTNFGFHQSLRIYGNHAGGASLVFSKTRNSIPTLKTTVASGDVLGYLDWYGTDGISDIDGANLRIRVDGAVSVGSLGGRYEFMTRPAGGSMTVRQTIDSNGYVTFGAASNVVIDGGNSIVQVQGSNLTYHQSLLAYGNNAGGASLTFYKTRNTDPSLKTSVNANDSLGILDWYGTDGTSHIDGAVLRVRVDGTVSTGNLGGNMEIMTRPAGGSMTQRLRILGKGSVVIGDSANTLSTTATDGFLYIPTCAGPPTGTPTTQTGTVPLVYDTTNHKFYIYDGSWRGGTDPGAWS